MGTKKATPLLFIIVIVSLIGLNLALLRELSSGHPTVTTQPQIQKTIPPPAPTPIHTKILKADDLFYAPILMYHHISSDIKRNPYNVTPKIFEQQMEWLHKNGYQVITYDEFFRGMNNSIPLPDKPAVITFDDGYRDQYENALPVLKKYGFTAMFYIPVNSIPRSGGMDAAMLSDLVKAGMEIASHTMSHADLAKLNTKDLDYELQKSKQILEEKLEIPIKYFAYPGGAYTKAVIKAVRDAGYLSAVTTNHRVYHRIGENPYLVPRIHIDDDMESFVLFIKGLKT